MTVIPVPKQLDADTGLAVANELVAHGRADELTVDFSTLRFARPFGTLVLAETLRDLIQKRKADSLPTRYRTEGVTSGLRSSAVTYLAHVGFFEHLGINYGKRPGEAPGSKDYLPITRVTETTLRARGPDGPLQRAVVDESARLAKMIFADECQQDMLAYCLRETVRNVFEHAQTSECTVMAQRYNGVEVEIAIVDRGIGIMRSLSSKYSLSDEVAALHAAILPGVTCASVARDSEWDNTGFGLYILSTLGRRLGSFRLVSSGAALSASKAGVSTSANAFPGTAIKLRVTAADADYFSNLVQQIVNEGEKKTGHVEQSRRASKSARVS